MRKSSKDKNTGLVLVIKAYPLCIIVCTLQFLRARIPEPHKIFSTRKTDSALHRRGLSHQCVCKPDWVVPMTPTPWFQPPPMGAEKPKPMGLLLEEVQGQDSKRQAQPSPSYTNLPFQHMSCTKGNPTTEDWGWHQQRIPDPHTLDDLVVREPH